MFGRALDAIDGILGLVPPLVWALALAACGFMWWSAAGERDAKAKDLVAVQAQFHTLEGKLEQQKEQAAARLAQLVAERDALQKTMNEAHKAQEIRDGNNAATIARQAARLRALSRDAGGVGLRDPNATGCRSGGGRPEGAAASGAADRAGDAPEAGGLLSIQLERLLLRLQGEADAVNRAYASCRVDAMIIRGLPALPQPDTVPSPAGSAGSVDPPAAPPLQ